MLADIAALLTWVIWGFTSCIPNPSLQGSLQVSVLCIISLLFVSSILICLYVGHLNAVPSCQGREPHCPYRNLGLCLKTVPYRFHFVCCQWLFVRSPSVWVSFLVFLLGNVTLSNPFFLRHPCFLSPSQSSLEKDIRGRYLGFSPSMHFEKKWGNKNEWNKDVTFSKTVACNPPWTSYGYFLQPLFHTGMANTQVFSHLVPFRQTQCSSLNIVSSVNTPKKLRPLKRAPKANRTERWSEFGSL